MRPRDARRSGRRRAAAGLLAFFVATQWPATAAWSQPLPPPAVEQMDVVVVNVEVWVTDRDGAPVRGLTANDFEVFEDGMPVPITHFAEIRTPSSPKALQADRADQADHQQQPLEPPSSTATEEPEHLVVYFDQLHLTPRSTRRLAKDLEAHLAGARIPSERVLIVRQDFELFTEASFGSTPQQIGAVLTHIGERATLGQADPRLALANLQRLWDEARDRPDPCRAFVAGARAVIASQVAQLERTAAVTLQSLRKTAQLLAGLPGHKTLLFVSDSLETRPGADLVRFALNLCRGEPELTALDQPGDATHLTRQLLSFAEEANRNRITVYPFQPSGLQPMATMGSEQGSFDQVANSGVDSLLRSVGRDGLVELARQTGGWAVFDRNRFGSELDRLADDMTAYYSLAYSPRRPGATGSHTIEVRAKGELARHTRLRHRLGYRDKGPDDVLQQGLDGAIAFGAMRNPLGVRIAAGVLPAAEAGTFSMPLHVLVPTAGIAFLPQGSADRATIRVVIHARNLRSREEAKLEKTFQVARPSPASELLDLRLVVQLAEGVHVVAVAVRDELTHESSVVATTLALHDPTKSGKPTGS